MSETHNIDIKSGAVITEINYMQALIICMEANSTSCKTWCITLVSAILVPIADKNKPEYSLIAVLLTVLFLFLNTYYLDLERSCRGGYD